MNSSATCTRPTSARCSSYSSHEARPRLVELMGADFDFTALMEVGEATREDILEELPVETLVEAMRELESDDAVAILETLEPEEQAEVLEALPAQERIVLRRSLDYPEDSAGRLMQTTLDRRAALLDGRPGAGFFSRDRRRGAARQFLRGLRRRSGLSPARHGLPRRAGARQADDAARRDHAGGPAPREGDEDGAEVARLFERYNLVSVPVVDESERLVGVITIDDIVDVIQEAGVRGDQGARRREPAKKS